MTTRDQKIVADTLRTASEWIKDEGDRILLVEAAAEVAGNDLSWLCPMCQEVLCDDGCPLSEARAALA